jgi:haloacetate dehalogenase
LLDHPDAVRRAAILDVIPTSEMYARADREFAHAYFHWFLLPLANDLPEKLLGGAIEEWVRKGLGGLGACSDDRVIPSDVMAHYIEKFRNPAVIHATCEDYRAGAGIDLVHLEEARREGRKITAPLLVLWAAPWLRKLDVLEIWRRHAEHVSGRVIPGCGHFIAEESPDETLRALREFFSK